MLANLVKNLDYQIIEVNNSKPWGSYIRISDIDSEKFIAEYFQNKVEVNGPVSPKILIVNPNQRLSWQYHNRRRESWVFLTDGYYYSSVTDFQGDRKSAKMGDVVTFQALERHRLVGADHTVIVAEIWHHTDPDNLSNEADIIRLQDDYS